MARTRRTRAPEPPPPRNTRADARRLFPQQSRAFQAQWVLATLRLRNRHWHMPIGSLAVVQDPHAPDFLRTMPRDDTAPLTITPTMRDQLRAAGKYMLRLVNGK